MISTTPWPGPSVVQPGITRPTAMRLAETEYLRVADAVDELEARHWTQPTDCSEWDVRQLVAHIIGQAVLFSTPLELARQTRAAKARQQAGQPSIDALTGLQVEERQHLGAEEVRAELHRIGPRGVTGRRRVPGFVRRRRVPGAEVVNGVPETWSIGFLTDVILTRDTWMHRLDLARATGRNPALAPDHDGVIVTDAVAEWARRHGQPFRLKLTGPAGGNWSSGTGGQEIAMDAADFCRAVSGRHVPTVTNPNGLLATQVPFRAQGERHAHSSHRRRHVVNESEAKEWTHA